MAKKGTFKLARTAQMITNDMETVVAMMKQYKDNAAMVESLKSMYNALNAELVALSA